MREKRSEFYKLAREAATAPQESALKVQNKKGGVTIGVPREESLQENRIALSPQAVQLLVNNGNRVYIETDAGNEAKFSDHEYSEAGAEIKYSKDEVFKTEIIVKVGFPTLQEIELMESGQTLISALAMPLLRLEQLKALMKKKVTALSFEGIKDEYGRFPVLQAMSEIAGNAAILIAAEYLTNVQHGKGIMLGGITGVPPSNVVILGAGTVGMMSAKTALGLGAEVKVFDHSLHKLRRLKDSLPFPVFTSIIHPNILHNALQSADVLIGALRAGEGRTPCVVSEEMVASMKKGSVLVDVSIDQGGCIETSEVTHHHDPVFTRHDVIHYCVPNIPSRVARSASYALSNIFSPILLKISELGGIKNFLWEDNGTRHGTYVYKGTLTNPFLGERFSMSYKDIDLLIAANI